jgi:hypothetical protein
MSVRQRVRAQCSVRALSLFFVIVKACPIPLRPLEKPGGSLIGRFLATQFRARPNLAREPDTKVQ